MEIRNEWMTDNEIFGDDFANTLLLEKGLRRFEVQKNSLEGRDGFIDGVPERFVVKNHTNPLNQSQYDKKLCLDIDSKIKTGSMVEFDGNKWIVVSKIYDKQAYLVASVKEVDDKIDIYVDGVPYKIPYVTASNLSMYIMGVDTNKFFAVNNDETIITVSNNNLTQLMDVDQIYKIGIRNYKVISIQDVLLRGILYIKLKVTTEQVEPIPDEELEQPIIIEGADKITIGHQSTYQVVYESEVIFELEPTNLATIISQNGKSCIIKANNNELGEIRLYAYDIEQNIESHKDITIKHIF